MKTIFHLQLGIAVFLFRGATVCGQPLERDGRTTENLESVECVACLDAEEHRLNMVLDTVRRTRARVVDQEPADDAKRDAPEGRR